MMDPSTTPDNRAPWWCVLAIVAAAGIAYHNGFHGPFVFDDASSIVTNPTIRSISGALSAPTTNVTAQGRPILNLSLALNYALGGTAVEGYHALNAIIHALAGLTLFGIVRRTSVAAGVPACRGSGTRQPGMPAATGATSFAFAVAVLWTVHPLQTESVTYIIQRAESLVGLFYLLTIYCFVRGAGCHLLRDTLTVAPSGGVAKCHVLSDTSRECSGGRWMFATVVTCLLGMATKEVMATAPLMVLFFDRSFFAGTFLNALRRRPAFYAALAGTWVLLGWLVAEGGGNRGGSVGFGVGIGWVDYWLTQLKAIAHYLWLSFWPHPLVFEYGAFWIRNFNAIAVPLLLVFGLLAATIVALWRRSAPGFLGAWFFGILAPTSLAPGTTQMIVEHRMYLPLAAVCVAVVAALRVLFAQKRHLATALFVVVALAFAVLTVRRNEVYRSDVALWTDTIAKAPKNPLAHFMLAGAHERAGNIDGALASYGQALELKPDFSIGHENFGELLLKLGRRVEAIAHFESALRLQPEYADAHANVGNAYLADGRIAEAVGHLEKAAQLMPESAITRYNFGNALAAAGLTAEAVAEFEAALQRDSAMAEAHFNLANALLQLDRAPAALAHYQAAVKLRPDYAAAHYNLANALAAAGRQRDAVTHYEAAVRARPDYPEAHHNLGSALFELGQLADAARHYEEALRLAPDFPNARTNLERVRARMKSK